MKKAITSNLYADNPELVLLVGDFVDYADAEIEDLLPFGLLADEMDRIEREPEVRLGDVMREGEPFVGQVKAWASDHGIELTPDWKVKLAKRVKERALTQGVGEFDDCVVKRWVRLFYGL